MKSVFGLEDKVRQEMYRQQSKKRIIGSGTTIFDLGRDSDGNKELIEKINNKKLPEHVKTEIEKEMKRMGG
jgi:endopeptidase La